VTRKLKMIELKKRFKKLDAALKKHGMKIER
jgi:hypothetical protein